MADISVQCSECGRATVVSEFAAPETLRCPGCGRPLPLPPPKTSSELTLRPSEERSKKTLSGTVLDNNLLARAVAARETESVLAEVHKARTPVKKMSGFGLWLALLVVGGGLVGWQYAVARDLGPEFLRRGYVTGRNLLATFSALPVLVVAFYDGLTQGLLCLLLPFYIVYYVVVRMEFNVLRGMFLGLCVGLAVETRLLPQQSLLAAAQSGFDNFVISVTRLIHRAGEPPDLPVSPHKRKTPRPKPSKKSAAEHFFQSRLLHHPHPEGAGLVEL